MWAARHRRPATARSLGVVTNPFVTHRGLLFTVAYEMLGSAADAEDVVQEAWLRWSRVDASEVHDPRAYLVQVVTRQALNRLRTVARRREDYVGEWLPEPVLTSPDIAEDVVLAESLSMAMLTVLETLTPTERVVFVLHEVFEVPYGEIAAALDKTPAAVRQIGHRARSHVAARQPRVEVDPDEQRVVVERFLTALGGGEIEALLDVLAPDVLVVADGGGLVPALRQPIAGAHGVAKLLSRFVERAPDARLRTIVLNGATAIQVEVDGDLIGVISLVVEDGRITRIFGVNNPDKLSRLGELTLVTRSP